MAESSTGKAWYKHIDIWTLIIGECGKLSCLPSRHSSTSAFALFKSTASGHGLRDVGMSVRELGDVFRGSNTAPVSAVIV